MSEGREVVERSAKRLNFAKARAVRSSYRTKIPALSLQNPDRPEQGTLVSKIRKKG